MIQPEALKKSEPLEWSPGKGTDVWAMFQAAITGDLAAIRQLLQQDPSLVRCHYHYRTPLYFAVRENQLEVVSFLLDHMPDPLGLAVNDSLLEITKDRGYSRMRELLETRLASLYHVSNEGEPVAAAMRERDPAKVKALLDASPALVYAGDSQGNLPIHWAVMTRQTVVIDDLLARGADINTKRPDGARPIHLTNGDYHYRGWDRVPKEGAPTPFEIIAHLRQRGAYCDINTAASVGDLARVRELLVEDPSLANRLSDYVGYYLGSGSPLKNAASRGHLEIVKLLLEYGADPNLPEECIAPKGHALYAAVYNGHYEVARLLLEHGAFPNPPVESSADALTIATANKDDKMVNLLCSYGAARSLDLLSHDGDVRTAAAVFAANPALADNPGAFGNAAGNGHEAFVRLMLRYEPDLAKRVAVAGKTRALTELLFAHGMNPNRPNWLGITPLHEFARRNEVDKAARFIAHGADLNARDEDICSTPLGWAAKFGKVLMIELLLRHGAKLELPDDPPWATPLAWATRRGHERVVALLNEFKATGKVPARDAGEYEQLAGDLVAAFRSGDAPALHRLQGYLQPARALTAERVRKQFIRRLGKEAEEERGNEELILNYARVLVARAHGFEKWEELVKDAVV